MNKDKLRKFWMNSKQRIIGWSWYLAIMVAILALMQCAGAASHPNAQQASGLIDLLVNKFEDDDFVFGAAFIGLIWWIHSNKNFLLRITGKKVNGNGAPLWFQEYQREHKNVHDGITERMDTLETSMQSGFDRICKRIDGKPLDEEKKD